MRKAVLVVALFAVSVSLSIGTASAATHYVRPGESIQDAIDAANSSNNTISNCTASKNEGGIILSDSYSNTITGNAESNNNGGIILTANSSDNIIAGNTVMSNLWYGILLRESSNNVITGNHFISNTTNAYSANSTNFWSDYKGPDADGDGLGDTSYVIDSDEDSHPLMCRFERNYELGIRGAKGKEPVI